MQDRLIITCPQGCDNQHHLATIERSSAAWNAIAENFNRIDEYPVIFMAMGYCESGHTFVYGIQDYKGNLVVRSF